MLELVVGGCGTHSGFCSFKLSVGGSFLFLAIFLLWQPGGFFLFALLAVWLIAKMFLLHLPDVASHFCFASGLVPFSLLLPFFVPCGILIVPMPMVMIALPLVPTEIFPLGAYQVGFPVMLPLLLILLPRLPTNVGTPMRG